MKLYKYRSYDKKKDKNLEKITDIIDGELYASEFKKLNDPMEGIYSSSLVQQNNLDDIFDIKNKIKICSLAKSWTNLALWGYYANGINGVCIEIDIDENNTDINTIKYSKNEDIEEIIFTNKDKIKKVQYDNKLSYSGEIGDFEKYADYVKKKNIIEKLLSRKHNTWKHENEYRWFSETNKIAQNFTVSAVYIGTFVQNYESYGRSNDIMDKIRQYCKEKGIKIYNVYIENNNLVRKLEN